MPPKNLKICFCKLCKGNVVLSRNIVTRHVQTYGTFDGFSTENVVESENTFQPEEENAGQASVFSSSALFSSQEDSDTSEPLVSYILNAVLHSFLSNLFKLKVVL